MTVPDLFDLLSHAGVTALQELFEHAPIGIYIIQDNRFTYVNPSFAALFGMRREDICGVLSPDDLSADTRTFDSIDDEADPCRSFSFTCRRPDGSAFFARTCTTCIVLGTTQVRMGLLQDVSQFVATEHALADKLQFIAGLIETIPSPVFYKDEGGHYLGCNKAFERYIGLPRGDLIGRSVFDLWPEDLARRYDAADQALFNTHGTQTYEALVEDGDGIRRNVIFYKAAFNRADGALGGLVGVILDISERKRMEERIWREANLDALTGLPNQRLLDVRLLASMTDAGAQGTRVALLYVDLDRFKDVNSLLGHQSGDQLLIEAGQRIQGCLSAGDEFGRPGGDEFIIVHQMGSSTDDSSELAHRIIESLSVPFQLSGQRAYVSASVGISIFPDDSSTADELRAFAEQALYIAKSEGRNTFCRFLHSFQVEAQARHALAADLRHALTDGQLFLHYQPIVQLDSGIPCKAEALLRWRHPEKGLIPPDRFIPIAEEIQLISEIGDWVFHRAAVDVAGWNADYPFLPPLQVSVNKSARQLLFGDSHESWLRFLAESEISPHFLAIEITESLLVDARAEVVSKLQTFRNAGMQISLDDFGTGYSAMAYLKKFSIDLLKIDRSFIRDMAESSSDCAIVEAIIAMAHKLGIRVVAEGVETEAQCARLRAAGCDYAQGYFFAKPMDATAFAAYLARFRSRSHAVLTPQI